MLLLAGSLPNCNSSLDGATCTCLTANCSASNLNCLDADASVAAVASLGGKNIRTIVIGFGSEAGSTVGVETLNAMALAGGLPRTCAVSTDCGTGDACTDGYGARISMRPATQQSLQRYSRDSR